MTAYVPILKAKAGELEALQHLPEPPIEVRPLLELLPPRERTRTGNWEQLEGFEDIEEDVTDTASETFAKHLRKLARVLRDEVPDQVVCAIDTAYVDGSSYAGDVWESLIAVLTEHLVPTPVRPVFRLTDSPARLAHLREVIAEFNDGACLRLGSVDRDVDAQDAAALLPSVLAELQQAPPDIDLVIDLWAIEDDRDAQRARTAAEALLTWAGQQQWRSVTVAGGAFPESISTLPTDTATPVPRLDARLWIEVRSHRPSLELDFGDYGIVHPGLGKPVPRGPLPNLRYTSDTNWQVYRQATPKEEENHRFYRICRSVVASEFFPESGGKFSWGDHQISKRAGGHGGPGIAKNWLAYGTSHHLAVVTDRLARLGEP